MRAFIAPAPQGWRIEILRKQIRHIYFRVFQDKKLVRVSAPLRVRQAVLDAAIAAKAPWLLKQVHTRKTRPRISTEMQAGDTAWYKGRACPIVYMETSGPGRVVMDPDRRLRVYARPGATPEKKQHLLSQWYRNRLKVEIRLLLDKWEPVIGVTAREFGVKKMKTRWGSCNTRAQRIWLNAALIRLSPCYLEYVLVHELVHLLERGHNPRFYGFMDRFLPGWKRLKDALNQYIL